jgi:hypothetical protein
MKKLKQPEASAHCAERSLSGTVKWDLNGRYWRKAEPNVGQKVCFPSKSACVI